LALCALVLTESTEYTECKEVIEEYSMKIEEVGSNKKAPEIQELYLLNLITFPDGKRLYQALQCKYTKFSRNMQWIT
jgi:hypothetical protein